MTKYDLVVASTRHHRARLLKYYPRPPCALSFVKSRTLRPLQTLYFLLFQQIFFVLVCIHPGTPRVPPRACGGNNSKLPCAFKFSIFNFRFSFFSVKRNFQDKKEYLKSKSFLSVKSLFVFFQHCIFPEWGTL